jgi:predicted porin
MTPDQFGAKTRTGRMVYSGVPAIVLSAHFLTTGLFCLPILANAQTIEVDTKMFQQLQATIEQQQEQLRQQAEQLRLHSERMDALQIQLRALQQAQPQPAPTPAAPVSMIQQATVIPPIEMQPLLTVGSGNDRISLTLSGQLNRAVNAVNDGGRTKLYHVDNFASTSRIRIAGTGKINDDVSVATRIEVAVAPDVSSQVSQTTPTPGTFFDQRWTEVSLTSRRYGKMSLGKGDTASNTTAEVDLSRTDVVQYATIADIAGGLLFRENRDARPLTSLKIADVFQSRDGLSRQSRLRYDTPVWYGFSLAGSLVSNQRSDLALFWGREGNGFRAAGAVAVSNPKLADHGLQYDGSASVLHSSTGLNITLSGGLQERDLLKDAINVYAKIGLIAGWTCLGDTALGVDYTWSQNLPSSRDSAWSVGGAIVQAFAKVATEAYLQYRAYVLDRRSGPTVESLHVGTVGARVKF